MQHLADKVRIVKDGEGYDVASFGMDGREKFIEVKTTTGNEHTPFHLSENEVAFMQLHTGQYCIYRVFHYDEGNNFGECFAIDGDVESQLLMKPTSYKVFLRSGV